MEFFLESILNYKDMGLFNLFGSNASCSNKTAVQSIAFKISTGLAQIDEELSNNNNQVTPIVRGIMEALAGESRKLYNLLSPNGRTDWNLVNTTTVKEHAGKEIELGLFVYKLRNRGMDLYRLTGINIAFSL